ncbi:hypothetical protein EU527_08190 [Candidatus Thorarchaeota archaeon]|nr:MAG: hypothetical protein EU527_08190 [Candidatus Thorarchaeota archaeon]
MSEDRTRQASSFIAIVFFGFLSMIFAEVFSGASPFWFLDAWGWLVTLPLYWAHALLLLNLALRYERMSLTQLYLWGVIFGLYEGWITKVIWGGYMGQSPQMGTFFGFAIGEFLVIGLFYHAIFSFIVPILVFQIVTLSTHKDETPVVYTSHLSVLSKTRRNFTLWGMIIISGSIFLTTAIGNDIFITLTASLMNFVYLTILIVITTSVNRKKLSIESLRLGNKGMGIVITYLILLYGVMFFALLPERIPSIGTILLTINFYIIVFALLFVSPKNTEQTFELAEGLMNKRDILLGLVIFVLLTFVWCVLAGLSIILSVIFYLWMVLLGPILFVAAIGNVLIKSWRARSTSKE